MVVLLLFDFFLTNSLFADFQCLPWLKMDGGPCAQRPAFSKARIAPTKGFPKIRTRVLLGFTCYFRVGMTTPNN